MYKLTFIQHFYCYHCILCKSSGIKNNNYNKVTTNKDIILKIKIEGVKLGKLTLNSNIKLNSYNELTTVELCMGNIFQYKRLIKD